MPRRSAGGYLIGAALVALLAKVYNDGSKERRTETAKQKSAYAEKESFLVKPQSTNEGWHAEERTHHSKERMFWRWTLVLYGLTFAATAAAAWFAFNAFLQTKRQADIAEKTLNEGDRPLIYIHVDQSRHGNDVDASVEISNLGTKPAIIVRSAFWNNSSGTVDYSASFKKCFSFNREIITSENTITPDCQFTGEKINPIHHLYGFVKYRSVTGAEWLKKIDFFLSQGSRMVRRGEPRTELRDPCRRARRACRGELSATLNHLPASRSPPRPTPAPSLPTAPRP